MALKLNHTAVA